MYTPVYKLIHDSKAVISALSEGSTRLQESSSIGTGYKREGKVAE